MIILFPSEPFSPKEADSCFHSELEAAKLVGFKTYLFDHDEFVKSGELKHNLPFADGLPQEIILRSWMLKEEQYQMFWSKLFLEGYSLINGSKEYLNCHHFPEAYPQIMKHTSKAWWTNGWEEHEDSKNTELIPWQKIRNFLGNDDIIIKDYVKSEKGNLDLFILKKELTHEEFSDRIKRFVEARGKLFNKGLVFKAIEKLKKYEEQSNEWRMFFLNKKLLICNQNSDNPIKVLSPSQEVIDIFVKLAQNIESNFFTMDIAEKEDGSWMILELGDGQVSGLPIMGDSIGFYNNMNNILNKIEE